MILLCGLIVFAMVAMFADVPSGGGGSESSTPDGGGDFAPSGDGGGAEEDAPPDADDNYGPQDDTVIGDESDSGPAPVEGDAQAAEVPTFTPEHLEIAKQFGFTEEGVKAFGSPELFVSAMHKILDARDKMVQAQLGAQGKPPDGQQQQLPPGAQGDDIPAFELKFENKEMLDPELVANVEGINNHYHALFKQVRDAMQTMQSQIAPLRELQFANDFDDALSGLPDEYSGILGKGTYRSLKKSSPEFRARQQVIGKMQELAEGAARMGRQLPLLPELCAQAVQALYAGKARENQNTKARQELNGKLKNRASQIIGRPTQRSHDELPYGDAKAMKAVREYLREHGEPETSESELGV